MAIEAGTKVATSVVETMKSQPLALALIVINVLFLAVGVWVLREVAQNSRTDRAAQVALLTQMANNCGEIRANKESIRP